MTGSWGPGNCHGPWYSPTSQMRVFGGSINQLQSPLKRGRVVSGACTRQPRPSFSPGSHHYPPAVAPPQRHRCRRPPRRGPRPSRRIHPGQPPRVASRLSCSVRPMECLRAWAFHNFHTRRGHWLIVLVTHLDGMCRTSICGKAQRWPASAPRSEATRPSARALSPAPPREPEDPPRAPACNEQGNAAWQWRLCSRRCPRTSLPFQGCLVRCWGQKPGIEVVRFQRHK